MWPKKENWKKGVENYGETEWWLFCKSSSTPLGTALLPAFWLICSRKYANKVVMSHNPVISTSQTSSLQKPMSWHAVHKKINQHYTSGSSPSKDIPIKSARSSTCIKTHMGIFKNRDTTKSSILIGFSIIKHPFWGTTILGNTHIFFKQEQKQFHNRGIFIGEFKKYF